MTLDELIETLTNFQKLGYGQRAVTHYANRSVEPWVDTIEVTGAWADDDDDEVVLETVTWKQS